jgi:hypothetical protein
VNSRCCNISVDVPLKGRRVFFKIALVPQESHYIAYLMFIDVTIYIVYVFV